MKTKNRQPVNNKSFNNKNKHTKSQIKSNGKSAIKNSYDDLDQNFDEDNNIQTDALNRKRDQQYQGMLPQHKNPLNANSYFLSSQKYKGKVQDDEQQEEVDENIDEEQQEDNDDIIGGQQWEWEQDQEDDQQEQQQQQGIMQNQNQQQQGQQLQQQQQEQDGIQKALSQLKIHRKQNQRLLTQKLQSIDKQDLTTLQKIKKDDDNLGNPQHLINQLNQFNKLVQIRVYSQKNVQNFKKFPTKHFPMNQEINNLTRKVEINQLQEMKELMQNFQILTNKVYERSQLINMQNGKQERKQQDNQEFFNQKIENVLSHAKKAHNIEKKLNVQKLWHDFVNETSGISKKLQQNLISWSQKTSLLKTSASKYNSLLMHTPIGQAQKAIKDWQRVNRKCQLKRAPFRILFQDQQNYSINYDKNIYDDYDLLQQVQKKYQQDIEHLESTQFMVGNTMKFLQNRSIGNAGKKKQVDRKASKNRKIRYNVHTKLLNFMPSQLENLLQARQQIVRNLFSKGDQRKQQIENKQLYSDQDYIDM